MKMSQLGPLTPPQESSLVQRSTKTSRGACQSQTCIPSRPRNRARMDLKKRAKKWEKELGTLGVMRVLGEIMVKYQKALFHSTLGCEDCYIDPLSRHVSF